MEEGEGVHDVLDGASMGEGGGERGDPDQIAIQVIDRVTLRKTVTSEQILPSRSASGTFVVV